MDLGLQQNDVADRLQTSVCNVANWETGRTSPSLPFLPRIVDFLGYSPLDASDMTLGQRIRIWRRMRGLSQRDLAAELGVDPSTVLRWEQDGNRRTSRGWEALSALLGGES